MSKPFLLLVITVATLRAQIVNNLPTPPPRVNPDLTVTYFFNAPSAREVRLSDSVHFPPPGLPLTRGPDGIWSVTTPPYEAGTHNYAFVVDGVVTGDLFGTTPTERLPRTFVTFELIDVRGSEPLFTDIRKVSHGTVHIETFSSMRLGREVRVFVYTPPGFFTGEPLPIFTCSMAVRSMHARGARSVMRNRSLTISLPTVRRGAPFWQCLTRVVPTAVRCHGRLWNHI